MSDADRERWENRYRGGSRPSTADPWVVERLERLPRRRLLEVAAGEGALALEAASLGFAVTAIDIAAMALGRLEAEARRRGLVLETRTADLDDAAALAGLAPFAAMTVTRYKPSPWQWHQLASLLETGGDLLLCSFSPAQDSIRPAFRLDRGELTGMLGPMGLRLLEWRTFERKGDHLAGSHWRKEGIFPDFSSDLQKFVGIKSLT